MLSLYLQQQGYRVVTASNGEDAIQIAERTLPNLILMDISMPTLDGLGATRRIREDEAMRDIPIIAVTAFGTEGFQRAAYDVGVSGYLTKPIDLDRMCHLIAHLLSPGGSGNLTS
jgi:CheY-like chemotaxis protein